MFSPISGEQATRMVVADGRRVAEGCSGPLRSDLLRLCDETEILTNQLADLIAKGQVGDIGWLTSTEIKITNCFLNKKRLSFLPIYSVSMETM